MVQESELWWIFFVGAGSKSRRSRKMGMVSVSYLSWISKVYSPSIPYFSFGKFGNRTKKKWWKVEVVVLHYLNHLIISMENALRFLTKKETKKRYIFNILLYIPNFGTVKSFTNKSPLEGSFLIFMVYFRLSHRLPICWSFWSNSSSLKCPKDVENWAWNLLSKLNFQ
jgi:hypothetical protein